LSRRRRIVRNRQGCRTTRAGGARSEGYIDDAVCGRSHRRCIRAGRPCGDGEIPGVCAANRNGADVQGRTAGIGYRDGRGAAGRSHSLITEGNRSVWRECGGRERDAGKRHSLRRAGDAIIVISECKRSCSRPGCRWGERHAPGATSIRRRNGRAIGASGAARGNAKIPGVGAGASHSGQMKHCGAGIGERSVHRSAGGI
jgi:hypothetical protein